MGNYPTDGVLLLQIGTGFLGSLVAGAFIAIISEKRFNQGIRTAENNIINSLTPAINSSASTIAYEIKRLVEVVDKMREGLEKTK
jgi:hypothetical protein